MSANNRSIVPYSPNRALGKRHKASYGDNVMAMFDRNRFVKMLKARKSTF